MELFVAKGFTETTVPEITARAGLTTRTFFRHFPDKREVLFSAEAELPAVVRAAISDAPGSASPMALIVHGLERVVAGRFDGLFEFLRTRRSVIRSDESLQERELRKLARLAGAIEAVLLDRGFDEHGARLVAGVAVTLFSVALDRWLDQEQATPPLAEALGATLSSFQILSDD